jgi:hypothetical protein
MIQPTLQLPTIHTVCLKMLESIVRDDFSGSRAASYTSYICQKGPTKVAQDIIAMATPEALRLQGEDITPQLLDDLREKQVQPWSTVMGYLLYITDDRDPKYLRIYIGQTNNAYTRIIKNHSQLILEHDTGSLPYFLITLGSGHRDGSFLRLWDGNPMEIGDRRSELKQSLAERFSVLSSSLSMVKMVS